MQHKLTLGKLGVAINLALISSFAQAQEEAVDPQIERVEVKGIRASLVNSMNEKRFADAILDGISAEDIGKFPDTNLAESLQRITGVSISRSGGEGRYVSIRGLGPSFSTTIVNGREIATDNGSRSFSFDTVASELVRKVNVYKTSNANLIEGGIGGLVDIRTAKPFDFDKPTIAGNVKGVLEENSGKYTPNGSLFVTDKFLDGRLGLLGSMTYQERESENYGVSAVMRYFTSVPLREHGRPTVMKDETLTNVYRPQQLYRNYNQTSRKRLGANFAAQYQVNDDLTLTLDGIYSKLDVNTLGQRSDNWFWALESAEVIDHGNDLRTIGKFVHADGYSGYGFRSSDNYRPSTTAMLGLNAQWQLTDALRLNADVAISKAKNDDKGLNSVQIVEMVSRAGYEVDFTVGDYPSLIPRDPDSVAINEANIAKLQPRGQSRSGSYYEGNNEQARLDFTYEFDMDNLVRANFGAHYVKKDKINEQYGTPTNLNGYDLNKVYQHYGQNVQLTSEQISVVTPGNLFPDTQQLSADHYVVNSQALWDLLENPATIDLLTDPKKSDAENLLMREAIKQAVAENGGWTAQKRLDAFTIEEKILSLYADFFFKGEVAGMDWNLTTGMRYSDTDQNSIGLITDLAELVQQDDKDNLTKIYADSASADGATNAYDNWLPSANFTLKLKDDLIFRTAYSKTLTRPGLTSLAPSMSFGYTTITHRYASGKNPRLTPYSSSNYDVSLAWYYAPSSMMSIAAYRKDVEDFIITTTATEVFDIKVTGVAANDSWKEFEVTRPRNGEDATIEGLEMNLTHSFDSGFGLTINYTTVDSDAKPDLTTRETSFALTGLSDTFNFVAFYDKGPWQARVAYNWRDKYLSGIGTEPVFVKAYAQVDARVSYEVNDNLSVFAEAVNLNGETNHSYGRFETHFLSYSDYGPRYAAGMNFKF
ncbi:TonB-dependent receptor [Bowmanella sp. Y26]|uniref:TonB-dependent receptor n=1 Tax=Bowmanella yangjiangensis TaxID=2811230 RepID=UPI001BDC879C|nr:TonB-dependent receptor [Bowmanella yangjiangensis]MBT1063376.1 TonB-dependent receptor [Bowmanella yangjiangensis]